MPELKLKLAQGRSRDFALQATNPDGTTAAGVFLPTDLIAASVWSGDGLTQLLAPAASWIDATAGTFQISFYNSDTASLPVSTYRIAATATRSGRSGSLLPAASFLVVTDAPGSAVSTDLVTQDYLVSSLLGGGVELGASKLELLPKLATAASRAIRRHCNRYFNRGGPRAQIPAYDGVYTINWPSKTLLLRQYPINAPPRVRSNPTVVLTVWTTSTAVQMAYATLKTDGTVEDVDDISPATTGLVLTTSASGTTATTTLLWTTYPTMQALANAVIALGNGWQATVEDGFANWPTADFRAGQGTQPALGFQTQTGFSVHADDVPAIYDARSGVVTLSEQANDPFTSPRFGLYLSTDLDDVQVYGGPQGIRVTYDAGWDTVPEDVQDACCETVLDWLNTKSLDQRLASESDGARSYTLSSIESANWALSKSVIGKIAPYRSPRA